MKKNNWLLLAVLYFGALMVSVNQMKVPPIVAIISEQFNITTVQVYYLMTAFTVAGIILALPSAKIMQKLGMYKTGLVMTGCMVIGSLLGAFTSNFYILLATRMIEGVAFAFITIYGTILISSWFTPVAIGLAMGVFTTWPDIGPLFIFNIGEQFTQKFGWNALWYLSAILSTVAFAAFAIFFKGNMPSMNNEDDRVSLFGGFKNYGGWMITLCYAAISFILFSFMTIYPQVFAEYYGLEQAKANSLSSLVGLFGIAGCLVSGVLITKTGKPTIINILAFVVLILACIITFKLTPSMYIVHIFLIGFSIGIVAPAALSVVSVVAPTAAQMSMVMAMLNFIYYISISIGAPIIGTASSGGKNWAGATLPFTLAAIAGAIAAVLLHIKIKKTSL